MAATLKKPSFLLNLFLQSNSEYISEQMEEMRDVAEEVIMALNEVHKDKRLLVSVQTQIDQMVRSFIDYATQGTRLDSMMVDAIYFEIIACTTLANETRTKFLALLGYSWNGAQIVEL